MIRLLCASALTFLLAGCATDPRDFAREPHMSPIGSGLNFYDDQLPTGITRAASLGPGMKLDENRVNLFRDVKAMSVGDVVTVTIAMDDRAILGNSTDRSREGKVNSKWSFLLDLLPQIGGEAGSQTEADRRLAERHRLKHRDAGPGVDQSLRTDAIYDCGGGDGRAAQRQSHSARIAGDSRQQSSCACSSSAASRGRATSTRTISISYDKIAEARVSYGGRGRLTRGAAAGLGPAALRHCRAVLKGLSTMAAAGGTRKRGLMGLLIPLIAVTVVGAGGGGFLGMSLLAPKEPEKARRPRRRSERGRSRPPRNRRPCEARGQGGGAWRRQSRSAGARMGNCMGTNRGPSRQSDAHAGAHGAEHRRPAWQAAEKAPPPPPELRVKELPPIVTNLGGDKGTGCVFRRPSSTTRTRPRTPRC